MTEQTQTPLVGPAIRRGWREIVRFRPLTARPHAALVVTRHGRLAGIIPADDRRVLSDYVTWPYDFREVDMRERLLVIKQCLASRDTGYEFDATLKLTYQVERPERVALELEDALTELEQALIQSMRVTSRSFGVEQAKALEENLGEALLYGDVLRARLEALGLALRRADIVVELDERARARAEALRDHMRERPLLAGFAIDSLDPQSSFDVLVGGSYRMISRVLTIEPSEARESSLHAAIIRTLQRVAITYAPQDYLTAAHAMAEALRHDTLLQAELSAAEIELVRPTVKIQPDRQMVVAASQATPPALPAPSTDSAAWNTARTTLLPIDQDAASEPDDAPPWASLGAAFGREEPSVGAPSAMPPLLADHSAPQPPQVLDYSAGDSVEPQASSEATNVPQPDETLVAGAAPPLDAVRESGEHNAPPWESTGAAFGRETPIAPVHQERLPAQDQMLIPEQLPDSPGLLARSAPTPAPLDEQIERWIAMFESDGPALFKLRTLEIMGQPALLPTIIAELTNDPAALISTDDPRHQHALAQALAARGGYGIPAAADTPEPSAAPLESAATPEQTENHEEIPDWLRLRQTWKDDGDQA